MRHRREWFTVDEICGFWNCGRAYFERELRGLVAGADVKKKGNANLYRGRALLDAWLERKLAGAARRAPAPAPIAAAPPANGSTPDDIALFAGADSPHLERFRKLRADQIELELAKDRRQLLPREEVHEQLAQLGTTLRSACDTLQRQFGYDALRIIEEALDDYERQVKERLGDNDRESGGASR